LQIKPQSKWSTEHEIYGKKDDIMPDSKKTWAETFQKRFKDRRNVNTGGVVPNGGLNSLPGIAK
jgi:hypothetical protein